MSYGHSKEQFLLLFNEQIAREDTLKSCYEKLLNLSEEKLKTVMMILNSF